MKILEDLFDGKIIKYSLLPLLISIIFWGIIFYFFGDNLLNLLSNYAKVLPYGDVLVNIINSTGWIVLLLLYYLLTISTLGVFSSFFIDHIVLRINEKHYNCTPKKPTLKDTIYGVITSIKSLLLYLVLFILSFWMLFIPVVNIFYQMFMWSILNKKPLIYDSSYLFFDVRKIEKKLGIKAWVVVFLTSFIYFIPIISWFGYTFQLIFISHLVLKHCKSS